MAYKVCASCGKHVRDNESHCWHCQSVDFLAAETPAPAPTTNDLGPVQPKIPEPEVSQRRHAEGVTTMTASSHNETADRDRSSIVKLLIGIVLLLLLVVAAQGCQIVRGMSVKSQSWDYIIDGPADDELKGRLQALGSAGWELVSARRATSDRNGKTMGIYEMIFRRPTELLALPTPPQPH